MFLYNLALYTIIKLSKDYCGACWRFERSEVYCGAFYFHGGRSNWKYNQLYNIAFIVFLAYKQLSRFKLDEDKTKPAPTDKK